MNKTINRIISTDLGTPTGRAYGFNPKHFIGTAIGAGLGVASSIIGGIKSAQANKEAQEELTRQRNAENAWYTRRYNEDYANTSAGQNLIRQAKDYANENWKKAQGASAVGGGTDAATAMAKEAGNKVISNTLGDIAAQDTARKANVDNQHMQNQRSFSNQQMALDQQKANNISQVAGAAGDALTKAGGAVDSYNQSNAHDKLLESIFKI